MNSNHNKLELLEKTLEETSDLPPFYRFEVFQGTKNKSGKIRKWKVVGMAYLKPGDKKYGIRLFTFTDSRFFLTPDPNDSSVYQIFTAIPNNTKNAKHKFLWNAVGKGKVNTLQGVIELRFDLFIPPIYLNIFPERSPTGTTLPEPIFFDEAA